MILGDAFDNQKSHRANISTMVRDELQIKVFVLHGYNLWNYSLQLVKFDLSVETAQLTASTKADNKGLKGGYELRSSYEHEHQMVESGAEEQPKLAREVHNLLKKLFVERDKGCVNLLRQTLLICA